MAIASYDDLAATVKAWCARSDTTFSNQIETFVALHEARIYYGSGTPGDALYCESLAAPELEKVSTLAFVAGAATIPLDAAGIRTLSRPGDQIGLDYFTPRQYDLLISQNPSGPVIGFTVKAGQILTVPITTETFSILYYQVLPPISSNNKTNALLTAYPLLYFNGAMFEAFTFMQAQDKALAWFERYRSTLAGVNASFSADRRAGSTMRVKQRNPIP